MRSLLVCVTVALFVRLGSAAASPPSATIRLRVRVEDQAGKPLAGARATLFKMAPQTGRALRNDMPLAITKQGSRLTGEAGGVLQTPPLPGKLAYVLEVDAEGFAPELTRWVGPSQSGTIELPAVKLRRLGAVKGTVVDRLGHPVPHVTVIQSGDGPKRLDAVTDGQGRFSLEDMPEGTAVVCFEAAGYRFWGTVVSCPANNVRIELERIGDPNPRMLTRVPLSPDEWPEKRRLAAAKELIEPIVARVLTKSTIDESDFPALAAAARIEPKRILPRIDSFKFAQPFRRALLRNTAMNFLNANRKPAELLEAASKLSDPPSQIDAYLEWFHSAGRDPANVATKRVALQKARSLIAASKETYRRGYWLCQLGSQLWDIGDQAAAREVFHDCKTLLEKMPEGAGGRDGIRIMLAGAVSRDGVGEAKKLTDGLEPGPMLRVAGEMARTHPQEVEAFLAPIPDKLSLMQLSGVANQLPRVCSYVARRDPAAAERILVKFARPPQAQSDAESIFGLGGGMFGNLSKELIDFQVVKVKAVCYGLIADAAAKRDQPAARHALLQAIDVIRPLRAGFVHPTRHFYHTPSGLMALLIPVAERIDRALANEIYWRALSLRIPISGETYDRILLDIDTPDLVLLVNFYDRSLAAALLEPLLSRLASRSYSGMPTYVWSVRTLTLLSPQRAITFPKSLSESPGWDDSRPRDAANLWIANVLNNSPMWDKDLGRRLNNQMAVMRSVYDAYVASDDEP